MKLTITSPSDCYLFFHQIFNLRLFLWVKENELYCGDPFSLKVSLYVIENDKRSLVALDSYVSVHGSMLMDERGTSIMGLSFKEYAAGKKFIFEYSFNNKDMESISCESEVLYCVRYKLNVFGFSNVESTENNSFIWYKDKGGRANCIEMAVNLVDITGNAVFVDNPISLKAVLYYFSGERVDRGDGQNLFVLHTDSIMELTRNASAVVKLRINEVSNRHLGQLFKVQFSVDAATLRASEYGPVFTNGINVKSKINKRKGTETDKMDRQVRPTDLSSASSFSHYMQNAYPAVSEVPSLQYSSFPMQTFSFEDALPSLCKALDEMENGVKSVIELANALHWKINPFSCRNDSRGNCYSDCRSGSSESCTDRTNEGCNESSNPSQNVLDMSDICPKGPTPLSSFQQFGQQASSNVIETMGNEFFDINDCEITLRNPNGRLFRMQEIINEKILKNVKFFKRHIDELQDLAKSQMDCGSKEDSSDNDNDMERPSIGLRELSEAAFHRDSQL